MSNEKTEFELFMRNLSNEDLGKLVREYIEESNHNGWDGFNRHHITGVNALLKDMRTYHNSVRSSSHD